MRRREREREKRGGRTRSRLLCARFRAPSVRQAALLLRLENAFSFSSVGSLPRCTSRFHVIARARARSRKAGEKMRKAYLCQWVRKRTVDIDANLSARPRFFGNNLESGGIIFFSFFFFSRRNLLDAVDFGEEKSFEIFLLFLSRNLKPEKFGECLFLLYYVVV